MSGTTTTAAASSTKRPAQAQAGPSQPAVKRSKTVKAEDACPSVHEDEDDGEEEPVPEGEMDDAMRARIARKNARVIRNRESAQRSRNQRKQHLAWLEKRVAELESENQQLREGGSPAFVPTSSSQSVRAVSPAHSVSSFATEIGLPIEVVSGSGGVSLASIAPPPSGLAAPPVMEDVKPTITPQPTDASLPALQLENAALRDRVSRLEDLLKHVVALSSFAPTTPAALALPLAPMHAAAPSSVVGMEPAQWGDLLQDTKHSRPVELGQTLSPVPKMNDPVFDVGVDLPVSPPSFSLEDNGDILACHSAAVATSPSGEALQRARMDPFDFSSEQNQERLGTVARIVVALARIRGWTSPQAYNSASRRPFMTKRAHSRSTSRQPRRRTRPACSTTSGTRV